MRPRPIRHHRALLGAVLVLVLAALAPLVAPAQGAEPFTAFETGPVRPLALTPDGTTLLAANTPDNSLVIFDVTAQGLRRRAIVPVGLEPCAVAARTDTEVWVVNHLSDSLSVVDLAASPPRVVRTLLVGDEPRDIVFAGPGRSRAFVTTAHRGQNVPYDPQLTTPGVGRADVWVFDANALGSSLEGAPLAILSLFGDTPRALATDGDQVYAAVFHSGNRTTTVHEGQVCNGGALAAPCNVSGLIMPGGLPPPNRNVDLVPQPEVGLIVKYDAASGEWHDELARDWSAAVPFALPDYDVFRIDATATPPVATGEFSGVGTILFNMTLNPVSGRVYVSNTDARNEVRFEGPGTFAGSTVRGRLQLARITVIDPSTGEVTPRHLNKHIDYDVVPSLPGTKQRSLATPLEIAVDANGATLYVAAFGSSAIGVFNTAALENDTFVPSAESQIPVSGGGPAGIVLDEARDRLYVSTRFDDGISVVDTRSRREIAHLRLDNPEPARIVLGRPLLYDARGTSSNGEASCASCHVFGDLDSLAWDLGNPDESVLNDPNPREVNDPIGLSFPDFHPMKGPMTTQTLRGMANDGPMHWRGDRTGGNDPGGDALDSATAFKKFIVAFEGLLGRAAPIPNASMQAFTDFILEVVPPPNPVRDLRNVLTAQQQRGFDKFMNPLPSDVFASCDRCHRLDPALGFFGTRGLSSFEFETQIFKIPHLRNLYAKVGRFGMAPASFVNLGSNGFMGDQVRGFGYLHDGSFDTVFRFLSSTPFNRDDPGGFPGLPNPNGFPPGPPGDDQRRDVEAFLLAFDSDLAPMVGQQATVDGASGSDTLVRIGDMVAADTAGECDLTVKGVLGGEARGWYRLPDDTFRSDRAAEAPADRPSLLALASVAGQALTFTCVPPGSGPRIGVDRDGDGFLDGDERDALTDSGNPASFPGSATVATIRGSTLRLRDDPANASRRTLRFGSQRSGTVASGVALPAPGGGGDPTLHGAVLTVYAAAGGSEKLVIALPAEGWRATGPASAPAAYVYGATSGPIRAIKINNGSLSVRGKGAAGYSLGGAPQGAVGVRLRLGYAVELCAEVAAKHRGDPDQARFDNQERFIGDPSPPPPVCPAVPE